MTSALARARSSFRHRIQDIALSPSSSNYAIELELLIDDTPVYGLPSVAPGSPLRWNLASHPCDVQEASKIKVKVIEKHFPSQRNRVGYLEYLVSEVMDKPSVHLETGNPTSQSLGFGSTTKRWDHGGSFTLSLTFPDRNKGDDAYLVALDKADTIMESKRGPLEGLGRFRDMFKTLIDVGKLVAEANSSAKLVVELCAMVWEHLEKLQQLHDDLRKLLGGLERMLPFIDFVKEHATNTLLGDTTTALLNLIEDASNFMLGYLSDKTSVRFLRGAFDGSAPDRVGDLLQQFTDLKEDFDRSVRVQILASVITGAQRALLDRLNPAAQSHYDHISPCQTGTRKEILSDIRQWLHDQNSTEKLLWLHGHAGQGKSAIASSICRALANQGTLGAHFFCKRDDPDLRSPERILNTIIHRLAFKYKAYGHAVSSAIDNNTELPNSSLQNRYSSLLEKPLQALDLRKKGLSDPLVVVVDALDECDRGDSRRSLLANLLGLSILVPWIKIIVTSRPDQDIKDVFGKPSDPVVCVHNVHDYSASDDIYAYIHKYMADIAVARHRAGWPDDTMKLLSQRADGLFIWAATACRFVSDAVNVDQRLKQIIEGTESSGSSYRLDVLYSTAIRHSMDSEDQDNIEYTRQCIAVIVATASRTPLSVPALEALLCDKFGAGTLRYVVDRLGSVLYEDERKDNVVRVYHPSFADYVTNPARSKEFHVTAESISTTLAGCCLSTMLQELRFNICGLETSHLLNRDVPGLESRVQFAIGEHLKYSCIHWSSHLIAAPGGVLKSQLDNFLFGPVLLFWIEALSLLSRLSMALPSLQQIADNIPGTTDNYAACAHDAYRFVLSFYDAISESTPHLYISALPLAPKKSMIAERMWPLFPNVFRVVEGAYEHWSACLRTISLGRNAFSVTASPDGRLIAMSFSDEVQLWDAETGEFVSSLLESSYGGLSFSHDGRLLCCRHYEGGIQVWDIQTLKPFPMTLPATSESNSVIALSCNDHLAVASSADQTITVWDLYSGTLVCDLVGHSDDIESIAFSPDGRFVASGSYDSMRVWDANTGAALFDQSNDAQSVDFSPDGRYIVCGCWNNVQIWDTSTYTLKMELCSSDTAFADPVAYAPDGGSVAFSFGDSVGIWHLNAAPASSPPLLGHTASVGSLMFSPNGRRIISSAWDGTVKIWDAGIQNTPPALRAGHSSRVNHVVFSPDDHHVLSAADDNTVGTWDASTGHAVCDLIVSPAESRCLSISPDSQRAVSWHEKALHVWDTSSRTFTALADAENRSTICAFSSDGLRIASATLESDNMQVYDVVTGVELLPPITGQCNICSIAYSPCGRFIASGDYSDDYTIYVRSADTGELVGKPLEGGSMSVSALAFSLDGRLIAAGSHELIRVYEVDVGTIAHDIITPNESITALAFSSNGCHMVSGSSDGTIRIWDMELGTPISEILLGHTGRIESVAFSHDGSLIASGSYDCTVRIWDAANTSTTIEASLSCLTSILHPATNSSDSTESAAQPTTTHSQSPNLMVGTSYLVHRLREGGWVSLNKDSVLMWLLPDYQVVDDSLVQVSARPLPHYSIDFSNFVHGDRWASVANDSVCRYNLVT